ncbi:hypothetical protein DM01DRAFT_1332623 [Hesseltinella vesiculosa]|uniref:Uncharacterized protein n=1 Tax=Hesseltinella vesiculosa TaxID=101127 RepID=A0A1X2GTX2_9FUNG|nr:hypothetical protein DM01DRAFT_1332623 [Hesseltinella vesiculosa]
MEEKNSLIVIGILVSFVCILIAALLFIWVTRKKTPASHDNEKHIETFSVHDQHDDMFDESTPTFIPVLPANKPVLHPFLQYCRHHSAKIKPPRKKHRHISTTLDDLPLPPPSHLRPMTTFDPTRKDPVMSSFWDDPRDSGLSSSASTLPRPHTSPHDAPRHSSSLLTSASSLSPPDIKQQHDELHQQWLSSYPVW